MSTVLFSSMTLPQLKAELLKRNLSTIGKKSELIDRLTADEESKIAESSVQMEDELLSDAGYNAVQEMDQPSEQGLLEESPMDVVDESQYINFEQNDGEAADETTKEDAVDVNYAFPLQPPSSLVGMYLGKFTEAKVKTGLIVTASEAVDMMDDRVLEIAKMSTRCLIHKDYKNLGSGTFFFRTEGECSEAKEVLEEVFGKQAVKPVTEKQDDGSETLSFKSVLHVTYNLRTCLVDGLPSSTKPEDLAMYFPEAVLIAKPTFEENFFRCKKTKGKSEVAITREAFRHYLVEFPSSDVAKQIATDCADFKINGVPVKVQIVADFVKNYYDSWDQRKAKHEMAAKNHKEKMKTQLLAELFANPERIEMCKMLQKTKLNLEQTKRDSAMDKDIKKAALDSLSKKIDELTQAIDVDSDKRFYAEKGIPEPVSLMTKHTKQEYEKKFPPKKVPARAPIASEPEKPSSASAEPSSDTAWTCSCGNFNFAFTPNCKKCNLAKKDFRKQQPKSMTLEIQKLQEVNEPPYLLMLRLQPNLRDREKVKDIFGMSNRSAVKSVQYRKMFIIVEFKDKEVAMESLRANYSKYDPAVYDGEAIVEAIEKTEATKKASAPTAPPLMGIGRGGLKRSINPEFERRNPMMQGRGRLMNPEMDMMRGAPRSLMDMREREMRQMELREMEIREREMREREMRENEIRERERTIREREALIHMRHMEMGEPMGFQGHMEEDMMSNPIGQRSFFGEPMAKRIRGVSPPPRAADMSPLSGRAQGSEGMRELEELRKATGLKDSKEVALLLHDLTEALHAKKAVNHSPAQGSRQPARSLMDDMSSGPMSSGPSPRGGGPSHMGPPSLMGNMYGREDPFDNGMMPQPLMSRGRGMRRGRGSMRGMGDMLGRGGRGMSVRGIRPMGRGGHAVKR